MITDQQKKLVQDSWALVTPNADEVALIFYTRLFELDPKLKPLFKSDISDQGKKLMQMLSVAVAGLDNLGEIVPAVEALGKRHVDYSVESKDYDTVGSAFLWTLEKGLGDAFTPELKEAWTVVYTTLATVMIQASESPTTPN